MSHCSKCDGGISQQTAPSGTPRGLTQNQLIGVVGVLIVVLVVFSIAVAAISSRGPSGSSGSSGGNGGSGGDLNIGTIRVLIKNLKNSTLYISIYYDGNLKTTDTFPAYYEASYSITGLEGTHTIMVSPAGYASQIQTVYITAGGQTSAEFTFS